MKCDMRIATQLPDFITGKKIQGICIQEIAVNMYGREMCFSIRARGVLCVAVMIETMHQFVRNEVQ